jgi:hypothetical protein
MLTALAPLLRPGWRLQVGTLTTDLAGAIAAARRGRLEFKMDRAATVHAPIGKVGAAGRGAGRLCGFWVPARHASAGCGGWGARAGGQACIRLSTP